MNKFENRSIQYNT